MKYARFGKLLFHFRPLHRMALAIEPRLVSPQDWAVRLVAWLRMERATRGQNDADDLPLKTGNSRADEDSYHERHEKENNGSCSNPLGNSSGFLK